MKRLFTFGCSFTAYSWPTWADILGRDFEYFENWGRLGAGNQFVFHSLSECWNKRNINSNDTVIIMWTNIYRNDFYKNKEWCTFGNQTSVLPLAKSNDERGYLIRDLATINATQIMLESNNINYVFLSMVPITNVDQYQVQHIDSNNQDVLDYYKSTIDNILPSIYETTFGFNWHSRPLLPIDIEYNKKTPRFDLHPSPKEHLEYLNSVLPNFKISTSTQKWVEQAQEHLLQPCGRLNPWSSTYSGYLPWPENFWDPCLAERL